MKTKQKHVCKGRTFLICSYCTVHFLTVTPPPQIKIENTVTLSVCVVTLCVSMCVSWEQPNRTDLGHSAIRSKAAEN